MYLLTQQNGPVRHVVSLYSERGSGIYTLHPYLKNDSYFIVLKKSQNISLWWGAGIYFDYDNSAVYRKATQSRKKFWVN